MGLNQGMFRFDDYPSRKSELSRAPTSRELRREAERHARKEARKQQKLQSIISRTGRVKAWPKDTEGRKPVSCTVFTVEDID